MFLDGEVVGDTFHAFDLLELKGNDLRQKPYLERYTGLLMLISFNSPSLLWVSTSIDTEAKVATYEDLRNDNSEGIVFKEIDAPYSPGRPNSGGSQLKFKFVDTASFIVTGINQRRSISLGLYRTSKKTKTLHPAGNVTIPPNKAVPRVGSVVEVRYLYAFRESGSIYQPVYLQERIDIPTTDCTTTQLKYKTTSLRLSPNPNSRHGFTSVAGWDFFSSQQVD